MSNLNKMFGGFGEHLKDKNILTNMLLVGSIVSITFASYISCFDINAFIFVNASTVGKHFTEMAILYVLVLAGVSLLLLFASNYLTVSERFKNSQSTIFSFFSFVVIEIPEDETILFQKFLSSLITKYLLTILIFSILYVGAVNALYISSLFIIYCTILYLGHHINQKEILEDPKYNNSEEKNLEAKKKGKISIIAQEILSSVNLDIQESNEKIKNGEFIQFFAKGLGIILVLLSFSLGIGRADFVKHNLLVKMTEKEGSFALFLTTSSGVGLYDIDNEKVIFIPWGRLDEMELDSQKRRYLR